MNKLDFKTFGINSDNEQLLIQIYEALSEIYALGNLQLRAAWLYYGGIAQAAKTFEMSEADYRNLVEPNKRLPKDIITMAQDGVEWYELRRILQEYSHQSLAKRIELDFVLKHYHEWNLFRTGAEVLLEMSDKKRVELFSPTSTFTSQKNLIRRTIIWQENQNKGITAKAKRLVEYYFIMWSRRKYPRQLFEGGGSVMFKRAYECKEEIKTSINLSKICLVANEIFREYEIYSEQWLETRKHIKTQRSIAASRRKKFYSEVASRDGLKCAFCGITENLLLDHIKAVAHGGLSVIENFQLLCFTCNSNKGKRERAFIHG